jgi:biotin synthase
MDTKKAHALLKRPLQDLIALADKTRRKYSNRIELCSIMNAKSGLCAEDCRFCAQSARYRTGVRTYPLKSVDEMLAAAVRAKKAGAERFGIVTSGNTLSGNELEAIADAICLIKDRVSIDVCASLGKMDQERLLFLKRAGLVRYHHNIETSSGYFPTITTTHTFKDRLDTIRAAKVAGLDVCSGVIIGLGETWDDRIEMALTLKDLDVTSVPVNILVPMQGTPLDTVSSLSAIDAIKTIALFRIILQDKVIKIAAGRESALKDFQAMVFIAGANGMLIGGYLTISGRSVKDDKLLASEVEKAWST